MGSKQVDYTGAFIGPFHVIEKAQSAVYSGFKKRAWKCVCFCGNTKILTTQQVHRYKSCGCQKSSVNAGNSINSRWKLKKEDSQEWSNKRMHKVYEQNAKKRGIPFELTEEDTSYLFSQNCFYCDALPANGGKRTSYKTQGIDRLVNSHGYNVDNVVPCCSVCNHAKHTMTYLEFIEWLQRVGNHMKL